MAYITYNKLWESELDGIASKRDKLQDLNNNQLKLEVQDTYKEDEKIKTNFEAVVDKDVIKKTYLDEKLKKIDGQISYIEKQYNEFKLQYNKQSVEDILIQRAVKQRYKYFTIMVCLIILKRLIKYYKTFYLLQDVDLI